MRFNGIKSSRHFSEKNSAVEVNPIRTWAASVRHKNEITLISARGDFPSRATTKRKPCRCQTVVSPRVQETLCYDGRRLTVSSRASKRASGCQLPNGDSEWC